MARQSWARLTINLEPAVAEMVKRRAKQQRRSTSAYMQMLLERDLNSPPGAYPETGDTFPAKVAEVMANYERVDHDAVQRGHAQALAEQATPNDNSSPTGRSPRAKAGASASAIPGSKVKELSATQVGVGNAKR